MKNCLFFLSLLLIPTLSLSAIVKVQKGDKKWILIVNGKPFRVKGAGCGKAIGRDGTDYLKLAKEMGANSVRTWGIDQGNKKYLDLAWENGLYLAAGIWINWPMESNGISYIGNSELKNKLRNEALEYVRQFKDHPAILMWNVGNEALFWAETKDEEIALANFLNELVNEIKKEDPNHPVIYAAAGTKAFRTIKEYVTALDILGTNTYGSIGTPHGVWSSLGFNKPYLITEYGGRLPNDTRKDANRMPIELRDQDKAMIYRNLTREINKNKDSNLGAFVFHLGDTTQESLTWWNLTHGVNKKQTYWEMYKFYTGKKPTYKPPKIRNLELSKVSKLAPGEVIEAKVNLYEGATDNLTYEFALSTSKRNVFLHYPNESIKLEIVSQTNGMVKLKVPRNKGIYRLYCFVKDSHKNIAAINQTLSVE